MTASKFNTPLYNAIHPVAAGLVTALGWVIGVYFCNQLAGKVIASVAVNGYFIGREIAQAEDRYMAAHKIMRSEMPWNAGVLPESWDSHSFIWNLTAPILVSVTECLYL